MGRLNLNIPDELHMAFRTAIEQREDVSQSRFLRRCIRAYADGRLWFSDGQPRIRDGASVDAPSPVIIAEAKPFAVPKKGLGKPDMTVEQYREFVNMWRYNSCRSSDKTASDGLVQWAVAEKFFCNEDSVRAFMKEYPPDMLHSLQKRTDKFLDLDDSPKSIEV